eukprot:scaffold82109_cov17-Prasinocladus_malaysianus.AAC.1
MSSDLVNLRSGAAEEADATGRSLEDLPDKPPSLLSIPPSAQRLLANSSASSAGGNSTYATDNKASAPYNPPTCETRRHPETSSNTAPCTVDTAITCQQNVARQPILTTCLQQYITTNNDDDNVNSLIRHPQHLSLVPAATTAMITHQLRVYLLSSVVICLLIV